MALAFSDFKTENFLLLLQFRLRIASFGPASSPITYSSSEPMEGTLNWAIEALGPDLSLVAVYGAPRAGKSVLAGWLARRRLAEADAITLWYCFSNSDYRRKTYLQLLQSCILQLLYQCPSAFDSTYVQKLCSSFSLNQPPLSAELHRVLQAMIWKMRSTRIYFVIDAVDECDDTFFQMLCDLGRLTKATPNCRIVLTSQNQPRVTSVLEEFGTKVIDLDAEMTDDRSLYLTKRLGVAGLSEYKDQLVALSCTMLHAKLLVDLLDLAGPLGRSKLNLTELKTHDETYTELISHVHTPSRWLRMVLCCVGFAHRPLTVDELSTLLDIRHFATERMVDLEEINTLTSKGLANMLHHTLGALLRVENKNVHLIHGTLQNLIARRPQFLNLKDTPAGVLDEEFPEYILPLTCLAYLKLCDTEREEADESELGPRVSSSPDGNASPPGLCPYALECWGLHLQQISGDESRSYGFFESFWGHEKTRREWIEAWNSMQSWSRQKLPSSISASRFAFGSFFGLVGVVASLAKQERFESSSISEGIWLAVKAGHANTIKVLLSFIRSRSDWKAIMEACCIYGYASLLEYMLTAEEFTEYSPSRSEVNNALVSSTTNGNGPIIRCLVQNGAVCSSPVEYKKLLRVAVYNGYEGALCELVSSRVRVAPVSGPSNQTQIDAEKSISLLHVAAESGSAAVIKALAILGVEMNFQVRSGTWDASALHNTVKRKYFPPLL